MNPLDHDRSAIAIIVWDPEVPRRWRRGQPRPRVVRHGPSDGSRARRTPSPPTLGKRFAFSTLTTAPTTIFLNFLKRDAARLRDLECRLRDAFDAAVLRARAHAA